MTATRPSHHTHVAARTVLAALAVTLAAAGAELAGASRGESLFLAADSAHLPAHVGILSILLIPAAREWRWVDPGLSLLVGLWLGRGAGRLLTRRWWFGHQAWAFEEPHG